MATFVVQGIKKYASRRKSVSHKIRTHSKHNPSHPKTPHPTDDHPPRRHTTISLWPKGHRRTTAIFRRFSIADCLRSPPPTIYTIRTTHRWFTQCVYVPTETFARSRPETRNPIASTRHVVMGRHDGFRDACIWRYKSAGP